MKFVRIDAEMLRRTAARESNDRGGMLPFGNRLLTEQFFLDIDDVGAGRLKRIQSAQEEWAAENDFFAARSRRHFGPCIALVCWSIRHSGRLRERKIVSPALAETDSMVAVQAAARRLVPAAVVLRILQAAARLTAFEPLASG
jgi:hypothetical protein